MDHNEINRNQKKETVKIGPKLNKNKQCKKQCQSSTIMMLASQKMEQEELLKEKKLEKTMKNLNMASNQMTKDVNHKMYSNEDDHGNNNDILFEEAKEHYMEEDAENEYKMDDDSSASGEESAFNYRDRQSRYDSVYGQFEDANIHSAEVDLSGCLKNHKIPSILRSKMADWMLEVFANYKQTSTDKTYFRALFILDLFFKKSAKKLSEGDVHLYGIAAMFLATKQEDISHISLDDIVEKVGHKKFSEKRIREAEYDILRVIEMQTDSPTAYTFLTRYIYKTFQNNMNQIVNDLTQFSIYILKMCLHQDKLLDYKAHILALSAFIISLKIYFNALRGDKMNHSQLEQLKLQEVNVLTQPNGEGSPCITGVLVIGKMILNIMDDILGLTDLLEKFQSKLTYEKQ